MISPVTRAPEHNRIVAVAENKISIVGNIGHRVVARIDPVMDTNLDLRRTEKLGNSANERIVGRRKSDGPIVDAVDAIADIGLRESSSDTHKIALIPDLDRLVSRGTAGIVDLFDGNAAEEIDARSGVIIGITCRIQIDVRSFVNA